jgi:hypothetical protein
MSSTNAIFLLDSDHRLERVPYSKYSSEEILQQLVAKHPELLAGDQIDPDDPPRWLLVRREVGVPDDQGASDRWSADHLLLDQNAVPTIVEAKRSSDPRIRREVIGQMLEYAANATQYWPSDRIRNLAIKQRGGEEQLDQLIRELLSPSSADDPSSDVREFWSKVDENLRAGKVRLLFVGDELPKELQCVIQFLNRHMPAVQVLGIEIRQYSHGEMHALVPRVIGAYQERPDIRRKTTSSEFLQSCPAWSRPYFNGILETAPSHGAVVSWGEKGFSVRAARPSGQLISVFYGYPPGTYSLGTPFVEVYLRQLSKADNPDSLRATLLNECRFQQIGQTTVRLQMSQDNLPSANAALPYLWKVCEQIKEGTSLQIGT